MVHALARRVLVLALVASAGLVVASPSAAAPLPTVPASSLDGRITVRLIPMDGVAAVGVVSATGSASWGGATGYTALKAEQLPGGQYRVSSSATAVCPGVESLTVPSGTLSLGATGIRVSQLQAALGALGFDVGPVDGSFGNLTLAGVRSFQTSRGLPVDGVWKNTDADRARADLAGLGASVWTELAVVPGPVVFTTPGSETNLPPASVLGLCQPGGQVIHYRGAIVAVTDAGGVPRTVNELSVENYLRGVVPREVSASWGSAGGGAGMHALRAQAVAARSYALSQNRYAYAKTCDTTACQAYGGAALRPGPTAAATVREHPLTDQAIGETAGQVRVWPNGDLVSAEYSASNGPRTAGGAFPAVDDEIADSVVQNPNHRWTRVIPAGELATRYGVGTLTSVATPPSSTLVNQRFEGIWANAAQINGTSGSRLVSTWDFRGSAGLPSPGFTFRTVNARPSGATVAFIGDSVGQGIVSSGVLPTLTSSAFAGTFHDAVGSRCTTVTCGTISSGLDAAARVPVGTTLAIVQLGYNDPADYATKINQMMTTLAARGVQQVAWVNLSTRHASRGASYAAVNAALAAAPAAWPNLTVLDWNAHSAGAQKTRWFTDGIHLSATGNAELSLFLHERAQALTGGAAPVGGVAAVIVDGVGNGHGRGMSQWGAYSWAVNHGRDYRAILDHYYGGTSMGAVTVSGDRIVSSFDQRVGAGATLRVGVAGRGGVPGDGSATAVALNVTAVDPTGWGFLTVWPCGSPMPVASNVNYLSAGAVEPNSVLVQLDGTGEVCVFSHAAAHVLVDVAGWFSGGFVPVVPNRIVDTRNAIGAPGRAKVAPAAPLRVPVSGAGGVPGDGTAVAVALNVTAVDPSGWGFLTVWPCGSPMPVASNVNYLSAGAVEPNSVLVPVDGTGEVCVFSHAPAHVLVDVAGFFTSGFEPVVPNRIVDTRNGIGAPSARVVPAQPLRVDVTDNGGIPGAGAASAVALNVTAVDPSAWGYLTVWPCGSPMPVASNVNYLSAGAVEPNSVLVPVDGTGEVCIYSYAPAHVLVDVAGWFSGGFVPVVPNRIVDTRNGLR